MQINPILIKEMKIRARIVRIPVFVMIYNAVLAFVGIFMLINSTDMFGIYGYINYQSMNDLFAGVGVVQCVVTIVVTLIVAAGGISGEREKGTLDMLFMTPVRTLEVVNGKLFSAVLTGCLFTFSSFPVLALGTIYGGTDFWDIVFLQVVNIVLAFFAGSIGLLCSVLSRKTSVAVAFAMILELVFMMSPFFILEFVNSLANSGYAYGNVTPMMAFLAVFLHMLNPFLPIMRFYDRIIGTNILMNMFDYMYGIEHGTSLYQFLNEYIMEGCVLLQLTVVICIIIIIAKTLKRGRNLT